MIQNCIQMSKIWEPSNVSKAIALMNDLMRETHIGYSYNVPVEDIALCWKI